MLSLQEIEDIIHRGEKPSIEIDRWQRIYFGMSLHIDGIVPYFKVLRDPSLGWVESNINTIYPARWGGVEYQYIFDHILMNKYPLEPELIRQWRLSQYKPWAKAAFSNAIQVITGSIFQDSAYSITIENAEDNAYIWGNNFEGKDIVGYISANFQNICEDPNGFFMVIPKKQYQQLGRNEKVEPTLCFIHTKNIIWRTDEEIIFRYGEFMWAINTFGYFRFMKNGERWENADGENNGFYAHNLGRVPIIKAGGQWNSQGYYDSWLDAAKAIADEYVSMKSGEQMAWKESAHPIIEEMATDCPECTNGKITWCRACNCTTKDCKCGDSQYYGVHNCSNCGGTGNVSHVPGMRMIIPYDQMDRPGVRITAPPVDIPVAHSKNNADLYNALMRALHLAYIDEAQSAVAKDKDMETRYQFLTRVTNDLFDRLIPDMLRDITSMRNVTVSYGMTMPKAGEFQIVKPTQFQVQTTQDLLDEYAKATEGKLPAFLRSKLMLDYTDKKYGGDDVTKRMADFIRQSDKLSVETEDNIQIMLLNGSVSQRDSQYHSMLPTMLDQVVRDRSQEWFKIAPYDAIDAEVQKIFAALAPAPMMLQPVSVRENV